MDVPTFLKMSANHNLDEIMGISHTSLPLCPSFHMSNKFYSYFFSIVAENLKKLDNLFRLARLIKTRKPVALFVLPITAQSKMYF